MAKEGYLQCDDTMLIHDMEGSDLRASSSRKSRSLARDAPVGRTSGKVHL